jgi:hypothetical protein
VTVSPTGPMAGPRASGKTMFLFKSFTLTWWQAAIFKLAMLCAGLAIGAYLAPILAPHVALLAAVAVAGGAYITAVWWRQ